MKLDKQSRIEISQNSLEILAKLIGQEVAKSLNAVVKRRPAPEPQTAPEPEKPKGFFRRLIA